MNSQLNRKRKRAFARIMIFIVLVPGAAGVAFGRATLGRLQQDKQSQDAQALVRAAREYIRHRQFNEAIDASRQAIALKPELVAAHIQLSLALAETHATDEALIEITKAIALDQNNADAYFVQGIVLSGMHRYPEALTSYRQSATLNPNAPSVYGNIGNVYLATENYAEAAAAFQQAIRLKADDPIILNSYGIAQYHLGQREEAIRTLKQAVRINPTYTTAYINLARWFHGMGRYEEAIENFTQLTNLVPKWPNAYFERSVDYLYLGKNEAAAADARMYLDLTNWHSEPGMNMAILATVAYRLAGKADEAKDILDLAAKRGNTAAWPYPIISFFRGETTSDNMLMQATNNDRLTEAHTYIGMDLLLKRQDEVALSHFVWVKEHGNKAFVEYPLALIELDRIQTAPKP
jgi:tetratricopeptide (TPR) repeat protein